MDRNRCIETVPEYYYCDTNDSIYKKCYNTCKNCSQKGGEENNNCNEWIPNYQFLNDPSFPEKNCYKQCDFYYYLNESNGYSCTETNECPSNFENLIVARDRCIHDCKNDTQNSYTYGKKCLVSCPINIKTYEEEKLCLDECYSNLFEYNNICYIDCPSETSKILMDRNRCIEPVPENYYLDTNDKINKICYDKCKKCNQGGTEINHNCEECIDNYIFLDDILVPSKNCYEICNNLYYFNEAKEYLCITSDECLQQNNKIINEKNKCIDSCKNDNYYMHEYKNKCFHECPANTKLIEEQKLCLDECYPEQFEYNNICYDNCPDGTSKIFIDNRNRCIETVPENYYLDSTDGINKKCYDLCKKCSQEGNENINNCDECINNYIFLNDSLATLKNCYPKCSQLYYFNEHNQYICIESCPSGYDKLILEKNKCIDDCKKDNEYIYEYDNNCLKECPEDKKVDFDEKKCVQLCQENQFEFDDKCYNEVPKGQDDFNPNGNIFVKNTTNFDNLLTNLLSAQHLSEEGSVITIEREDKMVYEITNTKNELELLKNMSNIPNKTIIDLGECENTLRKHYHINESDSLIIVKSEQKSDKAQNKNIDFNVYEPYNRTKLNLSLCDEQPINVLIPLELNEETKQLYEQIKESGYNMFDINDPFYQDICTPFDSEDGTDISLADRINYIYNNDNVKCQPNCKLSLYSVEMHYLNCSCSANSNNDNENFERKEKFTAKKIYESFYEVLKYSNYDIIKCADIIFDVKVVTKNIGSILVISYFACYFTCLIFYIIKGISPLKKKLKNEIKKNNIQLKPNIKNLLFPPIRRSETKKLVLRADIQKNKRRTLENQRKINKSKTTKFDVNIMVYSKAGSCKDMLDSSPKREISGSKLKDKLKHNKKDTKIKEKVKIQKKKHMMKTKKFIVILN